MKALLRLGGAPLIGGTTTLAIEVVSKAEQSLALVGNWQGLFGALAGETRAPRGALEIAGEDGRGLVLDLRLGLFRPNTEWPMARTVQDVFELSTRLLGRAPDESRALARAALTDLGLTSLGKVRLDRLRPVELRLVELAHALLGKPEIVALEDPLRGLEGSERESVAKAITVARNQRKWIVAVPSPSSDAWEQGLVHAAEENLVLEQGLLTWQGAPGAFSRANRLYLLTLAGRLPQVVSELERRGVVVRSATPASVPGTNCSGRLVVELPDHSTRSLLEAVQLQAATLLELRPIDDVM